jgi:outer membrane protein OmpA-like peptidoglycan-associated protein
VLRTSLNIGCLSSLLAVGFFLSACASSDVSREAASNVDMGVQNAKGFVNNPDDTNIGDSYQNSSQRTKGALMGGSAGAVTGFVASAGVGVIPGTVVGALMGASYGNYIDSNMSLQDQLENRGASVIALGDQILIVLPSSRIFDTMTSTIKPQAYSTLGLAANYINHFNKTLVKVAAYTGKNESQQMNLALSQQQAENVSKALESYGVDARVLYAEGYGGTHLVQKNLLKWSGNDNFRIEITLEKLDA